MRIDIEQISSEYLNMLKEKLLLEIENKEKCEYLTYELDFFEEMSLDQISNILVQSKIENPLDLANKILGFFKMKKRKFTQIDFFVKQKSDIEKLISDELSKLNNKILEEKEQNEKYLSKLKKELEFVKALIEVFCENTNDIDLDEIEKFILTSDLSDDEKFKLSSLITITLINKHKVAVVTEINQFEQLLATTIVENSNISKNIELESKVIEKNEIEEVDEQETSIVSFNHSELITEYFSEYNELFLEFGINKINELVDYFDDDPSFGDFLNLDSIEKGDFIMTLSTILNKIGTSENDISFEKYNMYLQKITQRFNYGNKDYYNGRTNKIDAIIEFLLNEIQEQFVMNNIEINTELLAEKQDYIFNIRNELKNNILSINRFNNLEAELKKIKKEIYPQQQKEEKI